MKSLTYLTLVVLLGMMSCDETLVEPTLRVDGIRITRFSEIDINGNLCDQANPPDIYLTYPEYLSETSIKATFHKTDVVEDASTDQTHFFHISNWELLYRHNPYRLTLLDADPTADDDTIGYITLYPENILLHQPDSVAVESESLGVVLHFNWK